MEKKAQLSGIMMNGRYQMLIAALAGLAAVGLVYYYMAQVKSSHTETDLVEVITASRPLVEKSVIDEGGIVVERIPRRYAHRNSIKAQDRELILGQQTLNPVEKGQALLWNDLGVSESQGGFSGIIREKERAIAIPADESSAVAGLLKPNDHVDIIGTFIPEGERRSATVTLLQNVTVLAVGRNYGKTSQSIGAGNVTVSVTPTEAELLVHAMSSGRLSFSLRHPANMEPAQALPKITMEDIIKPEIRMNIQKDRDVRVIKGRQ
jgi:pilus assembly protein CpaB